MKVVLFICFSNVIIIYLIICTADSHYPMKCHLTNTFLFLGLFLMASAITNYYVCSPGQFFDLQHCEACLPNCICSSMNTCTSCVAGYTAYNGQCIQCPQSSGIYGTCSSCCSHTAGTQISCTDCAKVANSYTFLYSGRCIVSPGCF